MANKIQLRRGLKADLPTGSAGEPLFVTDTRELYVGTGSGNVNMGGSHWYTGTDMTGTGADEYSYTGCPDVKVGDMYLNSDEGYVYTCTTAGNGDTAKWTYQGNIKGVKGDTGSFAAVDEALSDASTNPVENKAVTAAITTLQEGIDGVNESVTDIDERVSVLESNPKTWADIQAIVRAGNAEKYFSVGDQFIVERLTAATATVDGTGITAATVDGDTFAAKIDEIHAGDYVFTYDSGTDWHYSTGIETITVALADYGITVTGTAKADDKVTVTVTTEEMVFDVLDFDHDTPSDTEYTHSMTLQMHDMLYDYRQFDAQEAPVYINPSVYPNGLSAGTYCIFDGDYWYTFTLTKTVPAGGQIVLDYNNSAAVTYASIGTDTVVETASYDEDVAKPDYTAFELTIDECDDTKNDYARVWSGSNNWSQSALRQWLNSSEDAGEWWSAQTGFDRPPSYATTADGFLKNIDPSFLNVVGEVKKKTQNSITDGYGLDEADERFFLPARPEVYGGVERSADGTEGEPYAYYGAGRSKLSSPSTGSDANRVKYRSGTTTKYYWWLRSPCAGNGRYARAVYSTGSVSLSDASNSHGVAPACAIV